VNRFEDRRGELRELLAGPVGDPAAIIGGRGFAMPDERTGAAAVL